MSRHNRASLLAKLGAAFQAHQRAVDALDEAVAHHLGVNRTDLRCLDYLIQHGSASPGELAAAIGLTTGSVTTMLDRLQAMGHIEREVGAADRRRVEVRPTSKALADARRLYGPLVAEGQRAMTRYSAADLERFLDFLETDRPRQEAHAKRIRGLRRA